jgi:hypothetical protein
LRRRAFVLSAKEPTVGKVRWHEKVFKVKNEDGEDVEKKVRHGTYYLEGYRKMYQNLKKEYRKNQKGEKS